MVAYISGGGGGRMLSLDPLALSWRRGVMAAGGVASYADARAIHDVALALGPQLKGYIDFRAYASSAAVIDLVSGAAFTASGGVALGTGANGQQCSLHDGTDDYYTYTGIPTGWPTGANPGGMFVVVNQNLPAATTVARVAMSYGDSASNSRRSIGRNISGGVNCGRFTAGNGSSVIAVQELTVDLSGRRTLLGYSDGTGIWVETDGVRSSTVASVPATGTTRVRIAADTSNSPGGFWSGDISLIGVYSGAMTQAQADAIGALCDLRK